MAANRFEQVQCFPAGIQASCHLLAWSLQDVHVISLHGRDVNSIQAHLKAQQKLLILTDARDPRTLALFCRQAHLEQATITVLSDLATDKQTIESFAVNDLISTALTFSSLHVLPLKLAH